jgi:hypothetical protein
MALRWIQKDMMHSTISHECGWYSKTHLGVRRVSRSNFNSTHFLTTFKVSSSSIISASSSSSTQSASTIQSADRGKTFRPERSRASDRGAPCKFIISFLYGKISSHFFLDPKPHIQTADRNKFYPLDSPYAPYPIPAWSAALQAVDQASSNLIESSKTMKNYGHYVFPDPGLFIHSATAAKYIESWLRVRDTWFMRLAKESCLALSSQSWRTFLAMDSSTPEKGETKAARRRQEVLDMLLPSTDVYPEVGKRSGFMGPIVWQGREYPPGALPPENVIREILWELYEVNFIHELQSLDRRACKDLDLSSASQLFEREIKISQCFHTSSFRHVPIPSANIGLADDDFDKRFCFVTGLAFVMNSWKGEKPALLSGDLYRLELNPDGAKDFEEVATRYYCQQFFNYFGRAPQVPHRLFATSR